MSKEEFVIEMKKGHFEGYIFLTEEGKQVLEQWMGVQHAEDEECVLQSK
ncbi:hypothetical protein [Thalassobacillus sp. C254]|nr:hypothetical protein [Thalassobacillus sp. C254]